MLVDRGLPRVVATDCDGTLLRSDGTVSGRTRRALARAEEAGIIVVLVTARPPRWMHELAEVAGGHGVVLCGNGAFTYDLSLREVTSHRLMDPQVVLEVVADLRSQLPGVTFALESLRGFAREPDFERASGRHDGQWRVGPVEELVEHAPGKILVRHPTWAVDDLHERVSAVVAQRAEVSHSGAVGLAELGPAGVTKGLALATWCTEQGVRAEEVWAFGDMPNDLPMLTWAGRSFAVGNAHPAVHAAATDRCPANDEDGVAVTLEEALSRV
jgi:Cof subfamily protein (haloacid dehalogenase superfamily)